MICTLLAGSYPALYLTRFSPASIFKDKGSGKLSVVGIRKILVVFQFLISIVLLQGFFVVKSQINYINNKELGFDKNQKIVLTLNSIEAFNNTNILRHELLKNPHILNVGTTTDYLGEPSIDNILFYADNKSSNETVGANISDVDPEYLALMDFELVAGRLFDRNRLADTVRSLIINERMVTELGYTVDNAIGREIHWEWAGEKHSHEIIGIVKNFHNSNLYDPINNYSFGWEPSIQRNYMVLDVQFEDLPQLLSSIEKKWQAINVSDPFDYFFLDERLQHNYLSEQRTANVILGFTILALLLSILGLIGLAAFSAEQRNREVSIRKVLGASVLNIVQLLTYDFVKLVFWAFLISLPISWWLMRRWLDNFEYHVDLSVWNFVLAGTIALMITVLVVGYLSALAARRNPVQALSRNV